MTAGLSLVAQSADEFATSLSDEVARAAIEYFVDRLHIDWRQSWHRDLFLGRTWFSMAEMELKLNAYRVFGDLGFGGRELRGCGKSPR